MKFIAKKYYTFTELEARWECTRGDLIQSVIGGELVPSLHMPGGTYLLSHFIPENSENTSSFNVPRQLYDPRVDNVNNAVRNWLSGFYYVILPIRTGTWLCDFRYFADTPLSRDEGDLCYSLEQQVDIDHVFKSGVVTADEVARVEAKSSDRPEPDNIDKPLSTTERNTLLKLVIGMAVKGYSHEPTASKSTAPREIADDLAGLGIPITDDTVRKYLKEAANAVLPAKRP